jgi:hypothetical protein
MFRATVVLAALLMASPALAAFYVAGDFNVPWDPANPAYEMIETAPGSGIYQLALTGETPGRHEWKVTDGTWNWTVPGGPNSWLFTDANGDITITYDSNTYTDGWSPDVDRLGLSEDPGTWTAAGSFQGWDNANPATAMAPMGGGIYMYDTALMGLAAGTYEWKAVVTGSWDSISWDGRSVFTANMSFTLDAVNTSAQLFVDALNGRVKIEYIPEPASLLGLAVLGLLIRRR